MPNASIFTNWYLHLPSLVLAALISLLLARLFLWLALRRADRFGRLVDYLIGRPRSPGVSATDNLVMRFLAALTNPVVRLVGVITPRIVPIPLVIVVAIAWLAAGRAAVVWVAMARGVRL